jgi:hypothetical protein
MGPPMVTAAPPAPSNASTADQTVVSVGPYMFQLEALRVASRRRRSVGTASPPARILSARVSPHGTSSVNCHAEGVAWAIVTPRRSSCAIWSPSRRTVPGMRTRAPTVSGR